MGHPEWASSLVGDRNVGSTGEHDMNTTSGQEAPDSHNALEARRRQSGIAVTSDGVLTYGGRPIENDRVVALFYQGLDVRADGEVTLTVGRFWCYPEVAGVARFVRRISPDDDGGRAVLADGREIPLAGAALGYASDGRFYLWFDDVRGPALALRDAHQAIAGLVADDPNAVGLAIGELRNLEGRGRTDHP